MIKPFISYCVVAALAGTLVYAYLAQQDQEQSSAEKQPLYWVAPMDSNYRRDQPGKSPMGMDLVPVYEESAGGPGEIKISAAVINNLGVRLAQVQSRPLEQNIQTVGLVQFDENQLVHIHPRVEGWIEKLHVKAAGDAIKKGQALYELYSPELVNAQQEFIAELNRSQTNLLAAARERLRALQISEQFISQLAKDKTVRQRITFYARQNGVVDNLNIREGFFVQPGTTIMSIGSLDEVWVEAQIFERQAHLVQEKQAVSMTLDFLPGKTWFGEVDYIYPALDKTTRTLRARLRFDNPQHLLKPNMFAQVVIHHGDKTPRLMVPKSAVIRTGQQDRVVLALGNGRFKSVAVKIGHVGDQHIEILAGLSAHEAVVISAQFLLDSESSKTSDFLRMDHPLQNSQQQQATVKGRVNWLDVDKGIINISRLAIDKWQRSAATMDFKMGEALHHKYLHPGDSIEFTFEINAGDFTVIHWNYAQLNQGQLAQLESLDRSSKEKNENKSQASKVQTKEAGHNHD